MAVKITLTDIGSSISATLDLYSNETGVWTFIENIPLASLLAGYVFTPPVGATAYQIRDIGGCGAIAEFSCTTTTTTTNNVEEPCLQFHLTSDEMIDSEFDVLYCDDSTETITVPANHGRTLCAKNVYNPSGGYPYIEIIGECPTTTTSTTSPTTTTTSTIEPTTTTTTVEPTTTTTTTEEGTTTTTTTNGE